MRAPGEAAHGTSPSLGRDADFDRDLDHNETSGQCRSDDPTGRHLPIHREKGAVEGIQWLVGQFKHTDDLDVKLYVTESIEPVSNEVATFLYDATRKLLEYVATEAGYGKVVLEVQRKTGNLIRLTVSHESLALASASGEALSLLKLVKNVFPHRRL